MMSKKNHQVVVVEAPEEDYCTSAASSSSSNHKQKNHHRRRYYNPFIDHDATLFYNILTFICPPTETVNFLCKTMSMLSKDIYKSLQHEQQQQDNLWALLARVEYGNMVFQKQSSSSSSSFRRRMSKRIKRSALEDVKRCHQLICDRTKIVHYALTEMVSSPKTCLSLARLKLLLKEYGPILRVNMQFDVGGTLLVECCRARYVKENVIVSCIRELVEKHSAQPDIPSVAPFRTFPTKKDHHITALCVAAARGMPSVVRYLLKVGADPNFVGTGKFRLYSNVRKSIQGTHCPLGFAITMKHAELVAGSNTVDTRALDMCISQLKKVTDQKHIKISPNVDSLM